MSVIYIHIGTHKTGTTSLQHFLGTNKAAMLEQGILVPDSGKPDMKRESGNHRLAWSLLRKNGVDNFDDWNSLKQEMLQAPGAKTVISAEGFCLLEDPGIRYLRKLLEGNEVYIIVYFRKYKDYLKSVYSTQIRNKDTETRKFSAYIMENTQKIDYNRLLEVLGRNFGYERLIVRLYDEVIASGGIIRDFTKIIGFDHGNFEVPEVFLNPSLSDHTTNAIRLLQSFKARSPEKFLSTQMFRKYKRDLIEGQPNGSNRILLKLAGNRILKKRHERLIKKIYKKLSTSLLYNYIGDEGLDRLI